MADFILITGDKAVFNGILGEAFIIQPAILTANLAGTGTKKINGKKVCISGDERQVKLYCSYVTKIHTSPGVGMLTISSLADNNIAKKTKSKGQPVMLKGATFKAKFQVAVPAMQPSAPSPIPDATPQYNGTGTFISKNLKVKGI